MNVALEIHLVGLLTALACAIPGSFLVLRRMSLITDAVTHSVLLGIVVGFLVTGTADSPLLMLGAVAAGLATVWLVQALTHSGRMGADAAIALVFPLFFSLAAILLSRFAGDVHLDLDAVLLGELGLAPFRRFAPGGVDLGPVAAWIAGGILLLHGTWIALLWKELRLSTFDPGLAAVLGFSPVVLHYLLATLTSITVVGAFDAVGAVLVVALMIAPAATGWVLAQRLEGMLLGALGSAALASIGGIQAAWWLDASLAGSMATMAGVLFALALIAAPDRGWIATRFRQSRARREFQEQMLLIHLSQHEGTAEEDSEARVEHLATHLAWPPAVARRIVGRAVDRGWVREEGGRLRLRDAGRSRARALLAPWSRQVEAPTGEWDPVQRPV